MFFTPARGRVSALIGCAAAAPGRGPVLSFLDASLALGEGGAEGLQRPALRPAPPSPSVARALLVVPSLDPRLCGLFATAPAHRPRAGVFGDAPQVIALPYSLLRLHAFGRLSWRRCRRCYHPGVRSGYVC